MNNKGVILRNEIQLLRKSLTIIQIMWWTMNITLTTLKSRIRVLRGY